MYISLAFRKCFSTKYLDPSCKMALDFLDYFGREKNQSYNQINKVCLQNISCDTRLGTHHLKKLLFHG